MTFAVKWVTSRPLPPQVSPSWVCGCGRFLILVHLSIHPALCPLSCFSPSIRWRSGWPLGPGPAAGRLFPHISHVLTTSRWCRGEDCGRSINLAPVPCQKKLPLLFLQQSPSNYGFHTCRVAKPNHLTLLCHCHMPLSPNADRQSSEETGEVPWLEESLFVDNMQKWCVNEWRPFMGIQPWRTYLSAQL